MIWILAVVCLIVCIVSFGVAVIGGADPEGRGGNIILGALAVAVIAFIGVVVFVGGGLWEWLS